MSVDLGPGDLPGPRHLQTPEDPGVTQDSKER